MTTIFVAFICTALVFAFFLYYYVWQNRHNTQIRLAINKVDGRVISIERLVQNTKKIQVDNHLDTNTFSITHVMWKVIYKDRNENLHETYCTPSQDKLHWDPPLQ